MLQRLAEERLVVAQLQGRASRQRDPLRHLLQLRQDDLFEVAPVSRPDREPRLGELGDDVLRLAAVRDDPRQAHVVPEAVLEVPDLQVGHHQRVQRVDPRLGISAGVGRPAAKRKLDGVARP